MTGATRAAFGVNPGCLCDAAVTGAVPAAEPVPVLPVVVGDPAPPSIMAKEGAGARAGGWAMLTKDAQLMVVLMSCTVEYDARTEKLAGRTAVPWMRQFAQETLCPSL